MSKSWRHAAGVALSLLLFAGAIGFLVHTLRSVETAHILRHLGMIPHWKIAAAIGLSGLSYLCLMLYDVLAFRHIGNPLPLRQIFFTSFVSHAISNNIGLSFLSGGSLRLRIYSSFGVGTLDILKIIAFCHLMFLAGFAAMGGILFTTLPPVLPGGMDLTASGLRLIGLGLLLFACMYLLVSARKNHAVKIGKHALSLPEPRISAAQMFSASMDWVITSLILYILLPFGSVPFMLFLSVVLAAHVAGIASNIPGGLGVFEAMLFILLGPMVPEHVIIGSILLYRCAYYLVPFMIALVLFCVHEAQAKRQHWRMLARWIGVG